MSEHETTRQRQAAPHHERWGAACVALMEGHQQAVARWIRTVLAATQEIAQFIQNRLEEDAATLSALAACRSPDEAMDCQRRFAAKATEQYCNEATKLSQMMMRAA